MPSPDPEKLERLIHRTLRALPDREAPRTLEARVLMAIGRRAELPWWRRSYAGWPLALRYVFMLLLAIAAAALFALGRSDATAQAIGDVLLRLPGVASLQAIGASLVDTARVVFEAIPPVWVYGAAAFLAGCYAMLFGLGAAAYRMFFRSPGSFRPISP